jgi:hypothetical protein
MAVRTVPRADAGPAAPPRRRRPQPDRVLWAGLLAIVALAAALRVPALFTGLPLLVRPDEPTVVTRALAALDGQLLPPAFDWPPLSSYLLAPVLALTDGIDPYRVARVVFLLVALVTVALTGLLGARLADRKDDAKDRRVVALGAAAALAVSYVSVRGSRIAHPEHLQMAFMVASLLATLAFDRTRRWAPLVAAGALAGLAGATKYLGVTVVLPALLAVVWHAAPPARKAAQAAALTATAAAGVVAGTLGTVLTSRFVDGFAWQLAHQAGGHLGYEATAPGWWFHLTQSLPGNWGWPLTLLAVAGVVAVAAQGTRAQRLTIAFAVALFAVVGASRVLFPHYVLLLYPFLAPLAVVAAQRLARRRSAVVAVALALALTPTLLDDVRYLRAAAAPDTRLLAIDAVNDLPGPAWVEGHTIPGEATRPQDTAVYAFGTSLDVLDCGCFAVISSYQEQRYRRLPQRYAQEVAVYDALRARGRVVGTIAPDEPLSYRWDLLPQWGAGDLPLTGPPGPVGPTITVLDLR